jgi:hemerythrin-like domain-containing protein
LKLEFDRRRIVQVTTGLILAAGEIHTGDARQAMPVVTPPEDLMREHGVLNRVLLIYEAAIRKLSARQDFDLSVVADGAQVVRQFIEGYHERNEERQVFPRFRKAGQMIELVDTLYQQHQAGRRLTDTILDLVAQSGKRSRDRQVLVDPLRAFIAMYRPHEAREDTELFPQLRRVVSSNEFDAMAEDFERDERRKFGEDGFETMVARVSSLEQAMGIDDLKMVTPI